MGALDLELTLPKAQEDGTVGKALIMLDIVAAANKPLRFNDILAHSPFPKATTYRFLQSMANQGMLAYDVDTQKYSLGMRLVRLAHKAWQQASLAPIAAPFLDQLASEIDKTIHLAQIENGQVLFIDKRRTTERFETLAQAGRIAPAHCTGVGKAMLAFLNSERKGFAMQRQNYIQFTPTTIHSVEALEQELKVIHQEGIAYDREEHESGIISIAAPILTSTQQVVGAISIATSTSRHSIDDLQQHRQQLLTTASQIGMEAEYWQFPCSTG